MNEKKRLEKAYRDLQLQETPDLWEQIEGRLVSKERTEEEAKTEADDVRRVVPFQSEKKSRTRRYYRLGTGVAAAACCFFLAAGVMTGRKLFNNEGAGLSGQSNFISATMAAFENAAGVTSAGIAAETSAGEMSDGTAYFETQNSGQFAPAGITAKDISSEDTVSEGTVSKNTVSEDTSSELDSVQYENLRLPKTPALLLPEHAIFTSPDGFYFAEERLRDADLLGQMTVTGVSFDTEADGFSHHVVYEMTVDTVLYSENYVNSGQKLEILSPLLGDSTKEAVLYQLKKGGTYLLPLTYENGSYQLLYPASPQIEVTGDSEYVFHNGWQSLVNDRTRIVHKTPESPEDHYSDRLLLRDDKTFLSNLTALVETKKQEEKRR